MNLPISMNKFNQIYKEKIISKLSIKKDLEKTIQLKMQFITKKMQLLYDKIPDLIKQIEEFQIIFNDLDDEYNIKMNFKTENYIGFTFNISNINKMFPEIQFHPDIDIPFDGLTITFSNNKLSEIENIIICSNNINYINEEIILNQKILENFNSIIDNIIQFIPMYALQIVKYDINNLFKKRDKLISKIENSELK